MASSVGDCAYSQTSNCDLSALYSRNFSVSCVKVVGSSRSPGMCVNPQQFVSDVFSKERSEGTLDAGPVPSGHCLHCRVPCSHCVCHCGTSGLCLICCKKVDTGLFLFARQSLLKLLECKPMGYPCRSCKYAAIWLLSHVLTALFGDEYLERANPEISMRFYREHLWIISEHLGFGHINFSLLDIVSKSRELVVEECYQLEYTAFSTEAVEEGDTSLIVYVEPLSFVRGVCSSVCAGEVSSCRSSCCEEAVSLTAFWPFMEPDCELCDFGSLASEFPFWVHEWFLRSPSGTVVVDGLRLSSLSSLIKSVEGVSAASLNLFRKMEAAKNSDLVETMIADKDSWVQLMTDKAQDALANSLVPDQHFELGKLYGLKDMWVVKTHMQNVAVDSGHVCVATGLVDNSERLKMKKKYMAIHLDGLELNCQSYLPPGARGVCFVSLYDNRFIRPSEGFLGMSMFSLSKRVGVSRMKINYAISTQDDLNWTFVVSVVDHGLMDCLRPCNVAVKSYYKYTNSVSRFSETGRGVESPFYFAISGDDTTVVESSVREAIDYSCGQFVQERLSADLSKREKTFLRQRKGKRLARAISFREECGKEKEEDKFFRKTFEPPRRCSDADLSDCLSSTSTEPVRLPYVSVKTDEEVYEEIVRKKAEHDRLKVEGK